MSESLESQVSALATLAEPSRYRLYKYVSSSRSPVGRDEAATALGLPRNTAAFHLDRLYAAGLLKVSYERRGRRTGPGAGRPAKLYERADHELAIALPARHYELAAHLLASAIEDAAQTGESPSQGLNRQAHHLGCEIGRLAQKPEGSPTEIDDILRTRGYEPYRTHDQILLRNCPFHALADKHRTLVCGMNLQLINGIVTTMGARDLPPRLEPRDDHCCVALTPPSSTPQPP